MDGVSRIAEYHTGFKIQNSYMQQKQPLEVFYKKVLLKSCIPEACNFIKKETLAYVFSCEFCKNFIRTAASDAV